MSKAKAKTPWDKLGVSRSKFFRDKRVKAAQSLVKSAQSLVKTSASDWVDTPREESQVTADRVRVQWFMSETRIVIGREMGDPIIGINLPKRAYEAVLKALSDAGY